MSRAKTSRIVMTAIWIRRTLNYPSRIFIICMIFFSLSALLNGSLFRLWGMHRDLNQIALQIEETKTATRSLEVQLNQAKDPAFIERQARDKLDMVNEGDLVFVFSDGS